MNITTITALDNSAQLGLDQDYAVSDEQVAYLYEHGWVALPSLLSKSATETIRRELKGLKVRPPLQEKDTAFVKGWNMAAALSKQESVAWQSPFFRGVANSPRLGGVALRLMRLPEVLFAQDMSFFKPARGTPTEFHQDLPYFPFDRTGSISLWIALVDMTEDMGPLSYLDRSHREGPLGRTTGVDLREYYPHLYDREIMGGKALRAGDAQVHLDLTAHGASANRSDIAREAYAVRYIRPDTIYTGTGHPHYDNFKALKVGSAFASSQAFDRIIPSQGE